MEIDPVKTNLIQNNTKVYGLRENIDFQVLERDFLQLESYEEANLMKDSPEGNFLRFPANNANKQFNAVFMSPPWGGCGYNLLDEYTLDHIYPDFDKVIEKAT